MGDVRHPAPRGPGALARGAPPGLRLLGRDPARRHRPVDKDAETFTSTKFVNLEEVDDDLMDPRRSILETDGPRHRALRKLIQREFGPRNLISNYEDFLRGLTRQTVDEALDQGEFDFVKKISADFPIQVLARLLDVPSEDTGQLIDWGNQMVGNTDPDYTEVPVRPPGERASTSTCRSARPPRWRSSSTAGSCATAQGRRRHRPGVACSSTSSRGRGPAHRHGLRQLLPAPRHRRQRDHPSRHQPLHARR